MSITALIPVTTSVPVNVKVTVFFSIKLSGVLKLSVVTGQSSGCFVSHAGPHHQSWFAFNCEANTPLEPRSAVLSSVELYAQSSLSEL